MGGGWGGGGGLHGERAGQGGKCGILAEGPAGAARPGRDREDSAARASRWPISRTGTRCRPYSIR
ncbi:hypothetical protein CFB89_20520 [Burkholderia sp. AU16741]|nr:hypothetical protein CFB89_20520 [Burkholderia sp. AU16741]